MKYKVGDSVMIRKDLSCNMSCVNWQMKENWAGSIMTIRAMYESPIGLMYKMKEDAGEYHGNLLPGWNWYDYMIEGLYVGFDISADELLCILNE